MSPGGLVANPFLVLGGIAISVVAAAVGVLVVPGWVTQAQDAAALNDMHNIQLAQEIALAETGTYAGALTPTTASGLPLSAPGAAADGVVASTKFGVDVSLSGGVTLVGMVGSADGWCGVVQSASGRYFAGSHSEAGIGDGEAAVPAIKQASCTPVQATVVAAFAGETYTPDDAEPGEDETEEPGEGTGPEVTPEPEPTEEPQAPLPLGSDPDYQPFAAMYTLRCDTETSVRLPNTGVTGTLTWSDGQVDTLSKAQPAARTLDAGTEYTVILDGTFTGFGTGAGLGCFRSMDSWSDDAGTTSAANAFAGMTNLTSVPANIPPTVTNISNAFMNATSFNDPDVAKWDVTNVRTIDGLFQGATAFQQDINGWEFGGSSGSALSATSVFAGTNYTGDLRGWKFNTPGAAILTTFFNGPYSGRMDGWEFSGSSATVGLKITGGEADLSGFRFTSSGDVTLRDFLAGGGGNLDVSDWVFDNGGKFAVSNLISNSQPATINASGWLVRSRATSAVSSVTLVSGTAHLDADFSDWTFQNKYNVEYRLRPSSNSNGKLGNFDLSGLTFDNTGGVSIPKMVEYAGAAMSINADGWTFTNTGTVTTNMTFAGTSSARSLVNVTARSWEFRNGGNVTLTSLFQYTNTFNSDISDWVFDPAGTIGVNSMLSYATGFDQDLSGWDVSKVTSSTSFATNSALRPEHLPAFA